MLRSFFLPRRSRVSALQLAEQPQVKKRLQILWVVPSNGSIHMKPNLWMEYKEKGVLEGTIKLLRNITQ
jgi:hypothetical protein